MDVGTLESVTPGRTPTPSGGNAFENLGTDDFLRLLIEQISHQDPFEPTSNEEMMRQIATIRDIEMSTSIVETLGRLGEQQRFGSATSLIGRFIRSVPQEDGQTVEGTVVSVQFDSKGQAVLRLSSGAEIPIERVESIETPDEAAQRLVGQMVRGVDRRDPQNSRDMQGQVTAVRTDDEGQVTLELDTGESLRLRDVLLVMESPSA